MPQHSLPFALDDVKNVFLEKFSEIFACYANVYVVVDLYGNADAVALADAKAAGKYNLVLNTVLFDGVLKQLYDILRTLEVAGGADTNLYEQHILIP